MNNRLLVQTRIHDSELAKRVAEAVRAGGLCDLAGPDDTRRPDLLVFQLGQTADQDLAGLQRSMQEAKIGEVFLIADTADPKVILQAMRIGIKEFLVQPFKPSELKEALERFAKRRSQSAREPKSRNGSILSVFGSKGGVGTTTVAVNLAVSLAQMEQRPDVALLDMNTLFGEIPLFLEIAPKFHWGEITKNIDRLDSSFLQNILSKHRSGVNILPSPAYLNGHVRPTPEIMVRLLGLMKEMFDYVIIDAGQSTDDTSIKVLEVSDRLMLVTILSLPCLANTSKLIRSLVELGYAPKEKIKVILNRFMKKSEITVEDAEAGIGKEIFWVVPNDYSTSMSSINSGKPLVHVAPRAPITRSFLELATQLSTGGTETPKKRWALFN